MSAQHLKPAGGSDAGRGESLSSRLADRVLAARPGDDGYLRALTLGNLAAGLGETGSAAPLIAGAAERFGGSPGGAAYVNAMRFHARTQDDFSPPGRSHVGAVTLAAALALAEPVGEGLLESLAAGYEAMGTVARAYSAVAQEAGQRPLGMFGPFGAAATASVALGLDRAGCASVLGLAATMTGGTTQAWLSGTSEWLLEAGWAARAGVDAALLTEAGAVASPEAFEGRSGWCRAFFGDVDGQGLSAAIDGSAHCVAEVAAKPYPVSGIAQVPSHLACRAHAWLDGGTPRDVEVRIAPADAEYPGSTNAGPFRGRSDALMSVRYCVACGLRDGTVMLERLEQASSGELDDLVARVRLVPDAALDEGQAVVVVEGDDDRFEAAARDDELLFPGWAQLSGDLPGLARRTAADERAVAACARELEAERPDAVRIKAIWDEAAPWR